MCPLVPVVVMSGNVLECQVLVRSSPEPSCEVSSEAAPPAPRLDPRSQEWLPAFPANCREVTRPGQARAGQAGPNTLRRVGERERAESGDMTGVCGSWLPYF